MLCWSEPSSEEVFPIVPHKSHTQIWSHIDFTQCRCCNSEWKFGKVKNKSEEAMVGEVGVVDGWRSWSHEKLSDLSNFNWWDTKWDMKINETDDFVSILWCWNDKLEHEILYYGLFNFYLLINFLLFLTKYTMHIFYLIRIQVVILWFKHDEKLLKSRTMSSWSVYEYYPKGFILDILHNPGT